MSNEKDDNFNEVILEEYSKEFGEKLRGEMAESSKQIMEVFLEEYSKEFGEKLRGEMAESSKQIMEVILKDSASLRSNQANGHDDGEPLTKISEQMENQSAKGQKQGRHT